MTENVGNRWRFVFAAIAMQLCLGVLYSWGVFREPLETLHGWSRATTAQPYRFALLSLTLSTIIAGFWQDRQGPRLVGSVAGVFLAAGCFLASIFGDTPTGLVITYGFIGGLGLGFGYVTPVATCIKWFPDKRGLVVGLAVMGFGAGSLIFAPFLESLIGNDPAQYAVTIPRTFQIMSVIFLICVVGAAQVYRVPPPGWKPEGWTPPTITGNAAMKQDYTAGEMLRTWQFYVLWVIYLLGVSVGVTTIGQAPQLMTEMGARGAIMTGGASLGLMSLFNGLGRLSWGALSDKLGRNRTLLTMFGIYIVACLGLLRTANSFWPLLVGICMVGFTYGGYLSLIPSLTADYFGAKNVGANYGLMFTAFGLCGYFMPGVAAEMMDAARQADDLAAGYNQIYTGLAAICLIGVLLTLVVRRPTPRAPRESAVSEVT